MTEPTVAAAEPTGNAAAPVIDPAAAAPAAAVDTPTPEPVAYSLALPENTKLDPKGADDLDRGQAAGCHSPRAGRQRSR